jgi:hypothetical protein
MMMTSAPGSGRQKIARMKTQPLGQAKGLHILVKDGAYHFQVEFAAGRVWMGQRQLNGNASLRASDVNKTLDASPRKLLRQRAGCAHADAGHRGQELFEPRRV